jgi:hypothetical protein
VPTVDPSATAVTREADWLLTTGDGLPALLESAGGRWEIVQAYWPGARAHQKKAGVYVTKKNGNEEHPTAQRYRPRYLFTLKLIWPVKNPNPPIAETEQQNFDNAIGDLLIRLRGLLGDKTHGGRFLSVGEVPENGSISVDFEDPETTITDAGELRATASYYADDLEFNG